MRTAILVATAAHRISASPRGRWLTRIRRPRRLAGLLGAPAVVAALLLLGACSPEAEGGGGPRVEESASAGGKEPFSSGPIDTLEQAEERDYRGLSPIPIDTVRRSRSLGDTDSFGWITEITPFSDFLLVADARMRPHLVTVDRRTGSVLTKFGEHGEGPGEFRSPRAIFRPRGSTARAAVFDFQNRRLSWYRFPRGGRAPVLVQDHPLRADAFIWKPVPLEEDGFIANGVFPDYTLVRLDSAGRVLRRLRTALPFDGTGEAQGANPATLASFNVSSFAAEPGGPRLAVGFVAADLLVFLESWHGPYVLVHGPRQNRIVIEVRGGAPGFVRGQHEDAYADGAVSDNDSLLWAHYASPYPLIGEWKLPAGLRREPPR